MTVTVLFPRARPVGPGPSITSRDRPRPARGIEKERTLSRLDFFLCSKHYTMYSCTQGRIKALRGPMPKYFVGPITHTAYTVQSVNQFGSVDTQNTIYFY